MNIEVRIAKPEEFPEINEIRRMVNDVHVNGRPDIFRAGFCQELQDHVYVQAEKEDSDVVVALVDGEIAGFATVEYVHRPESPYNLARDYYHVEEFGVSEKHRREGVATALVNYMKEEARAKGFPRIELDMWEFNQGALAFYEAAGFETFRRYMEIKL